MLSDVTMLLLLKLMIVSVMTMMVMTERQATDN